MKSELRFVMHPDDETAFAGQVLAEECVRLVDGPRWKSPDPVATRSLKEVVGDYCIIWCTQDRPSLSARRLATDDWYCESESATIQFLRSQLRGSCLSTGRIAIGTGDATQTEAVAVERRFKCLVRFIKKTYENSAIRWCNTQLPFAKAIPGQSSNPSNPDVHCWIGPHARRWLREDTARRIKQSAESPVEARLLEHF